MQAIIANGKPKEIAALAIAMQERLSPTIKLNIGGREFGGSLYGLVTGREKSPGKLIQKAVQKANHDKPATD